MKTTIDIAEPLLTQAKRTAALEGLTLRELVEEALRRLLAEREQRGPFKLRRASFDGRGLQSEVAEGSWQVVRDLTYEGRGA